MEERTNKHGLGLALNVRREKFWHFSGIQWLSRACTRTKFPYSNQERSTYTSEFESHWVPLSYGLVPHLSKKLSKLPRTQTHPLALTDLASVSTSSNPSPQQPPLPNRRLSLTVANFYLLTALGPCLSSSSSSLVGNLALKAFVWVSYDTDKRILWLAFTTTHRMNAHHRATVECRLDFPCWLLREHLPIKTH